MFFRFLKHNHLILASLVVTCITVAAGCASIGTPGGGWYDETPPERRSSKPDEGETGVSERKIAVHFNENIKLSNVMDKLTISPPQQKSPIILSNAKTVTIELQDTLIPNTTYTIDLGDAVVDNNEGNVLDHFSLTFSTGNHIDTMMIGGTLLNAADLEPVTGAYVGIYPDTMMVGDTAMVVGDSAFLSLPMIRAAKTDAYGAFRIAGVAPGRYRLYALRDGNTNYYYDLFTEDIAFLDSLVVPTVENKLVRDTVWADSLTIDTVLVHGHIDYGPANLLLRLFNEGKYNRYMDDYARPDSARLTFRFAAAMPSLPEFRLLGDSLPIAEGRTIMEANRTMDTLTLWLADTLLYRADTLRLAVTYIHTDTLRQDVPTTDTLTFLRPVERTVSDDGESTLGKLKGKFSKKKSSRKKEAAADTVPTVRHMTASLVNGNSLNIGARPVVEVSAPLAVCDTAGIHLDMRKDSLWLPMTYQWIKDTASVRRYIVRAVPYYSPGTEYRISIDSAAMRDIFDAPIAATALTFRERVPEDYAHLLFNIRGIDGPAFVQLLNEQDRPVQQAKVIGGQAKFVHVLPGTYYARLVEDRNDNGRFDAGNLAERRQPEQVYYFDGQLQLRANWQFAQEWTPTAKDLIRQKPEEVKSNKPKEKKEKKNRNAEYAAQRGLTLPPSLATPDDDTTTAGNTKPKNTTTTRR